MHIALVNRWYPPNSHGGVAMHNSHFAEACYRLGHKVTVIAQAAPGRPQREERNGVVVHRVSAPSFHRYKRVPLLGPHYHMLHIMLYSRTANQRLRAVHRREPVDIVEFADINAEGLLWRGSAGKLVVRCHTPVFVLEKFFRQAEMPYNPLLPARAEKRVIRQAALITTPSQHLADIVRDACQLPSERFFPIANALNTEVFTPGAEGKDPSTITILHVGRMERAKGIDTLADAIPRVCDEIAQARFVFVGGDRRRADGSSTRAAIEEKLRPYIEKGQVEIRGSVSDEALVPTYQEADICVVPSELYESFSYTVAQAMACGLPVVASRIGGIPETLGHGDCGLLFEPGSVGGLAENLIDLCRDRSKREQLGLAGRKRAVSEFSAPVVAERTLQVYGTLLSD